MEKEFVPYEEVLELRELGFNESCLAYRIGISLYLNANGVSESGMSGEIPTPLYQQAFDFFRIKYNMLANVYSNASGYLYEWHDAVGGTHRFDSDFSGPNDSGCWDDYDEAKLECLRKLIQTVKSKQK